MKKISSIDTTLLTINLLICGLGSMVNVINDYQSGISFISNFERWDTIWPTFLPICTAIFSAFGLLKMQWSRYLGFIFGASYFVVVAFAVLFISFENLKLGISIGVIPFILVISSLGLGNLYALYLERKRQSPTA